MQELTLKLNLNEVNAILNTLGQAPFVQVAPLINKIQQQVQPQLPATAGDATA